MRIVVLDGYTLNPGDLSWAALEALGGATIHDRTPPDQVVKRAAGAAVVLTNKTVFDRAAISALPKLRYIGVLATGYNVVDVAAARERGVVVTNVPAYGTASVAQMVFAHLLNLAQRVGDHSASVRRGDWSRSADFCYWTAPLIELEGLTMGIVGYGRIGRAVARLALAFGMRVLLHDQRRSRIPRGCAWVSLEALCRDSDVVSLHCPLTPDTRGLVNAQFLVRLKPTAFLINTSRGPLIDEPALAAALNAGRLAGAGLDVLAVEPPPADHPLLTARNCFLTPHIAWATKAARVRLLRTAADNVAAFLAGRPQNVVN
jgi:glycerate dehydrogenase